MLPLNAHGFFIKKSYNDTDQIITNLNSYWNDSYHI